MVFRYARAALLTDPIPARKLGAWLFLCAIIAVGWSAACYLALYRMSYAGLDDWATFAPGAAAKRPFELTAPLMGDFLGADHTWGIHWPGAALLYSCLFAFVPWSPLLRVILMMGLCVGTAAVTFLLVRRYFCDLLLSAAGAFIILCDRPLVSLLGIARPEVLATLVLAALVFFLSGLNQGRVSQPGRLAGAGGCFFLLPLLHPVLVPLGGLLCVYAGWRAWQKNRLPQGIGLAICYGIGVATLVGWFYFQPDALRQFRINEAMNTAPFRWLGTFVAFLRGDPMPHTTTVLYLLAFIGVGATWPRSQHSAPENPQAGVTVPQLDWTLPIVTLLGGTASAQLFHNPFYQVIMVPEAVLLAVAGLHWLVHRLTRRDDGGAWIVAPMLLAFAALHGLFWVPHTLTFFRAGRPNFRAEMHALALSMPTDRTILISDLLWEEGIQQPHGHFVLYTLPFPCPSEVRQAYEDTTVGRAKSGDMLLLDGHDLVPLRTPLPPEQWEAVATRERHLPSRAYWGYGMIIYRRK